MKFHQLAELKEGRLSYNKERAKALLENLYEGTYLISFLRLNPKSTIKDYRACYFAKIDAIGAEVGETRYDIHELIKEHVMSKMLDEIPEVFTTEGITTQNLTENGWVVLLEAVDLWAFTEYSIVIN